MGVNWRECVPAGVAVLAESCESVMRHYTPYVYYLVDGDEVVYVGRSENIMTRLTHHSIGKIRKPFDLVMLRPCQSFRESVDLEAAEIERLRPRFNRRRGWTPDESDDQRLDGHASYRVAGLLEDLEANGGR